MNVAAMLTEVATYAPHLTDQNVADRHVVPVESLRAALRVLAFMGFVEHVDGNPLGHTWEARKPNDASPRVRRLRAELEKPLEEFIASRAFQEFDAERESYEASRQASS